MLFCGSTGREATDPDGVSIASLCQMSRMMPSMMLVAGLGDQNPMFAQYDILERVICTPWELEPRLY